MDNFENEIENYLAKKRNEMKTKYNRVLPTGETLFNRFDKGKYLNAGENSSIYDTSVVMGDVIIGNHVWVGPYTILKGLTETLTIGNFVSINAGVMIYTHDSTKYYVSGGKNPYEKGKVTIEDNVVIGTMSTVSCGTIIGNHSVVAAYSFVTKDVPDHSIVAGIPAKVIGKVIENEDGEVSFEYFK